MSCTIIYINQLLVKRNVGKKDKRPIEKKRLWRNEAMKKGGHERDYYYCRSTSSCAACKFLKRRCTPDCIFAPYFRSDEWRKFAKVHKVFGASNVSKILSWVPEEQREDAVNSLAYEAEARIRDPVYGCIGAIALLQNKMVELQHALAIARARLASYTEKTPSLLLYDEDDIDFVSLHGGLPFSDGMKNERNFIYSSSESFATL